MAACDIPEPSGDPGEGGDGEGQQCGHCGLSRSSKVSSAGSGGKDSGVKRSLVNLLKPRQLLQAASDLLPCVISMSCLTHCRHAVEQVIHRGAKSDQQQEEHAIFREAADRLDRALMDQTSRKGSGLSDGTAKALHSNRNAHMAQFLSGAAKRELVEQRRAGEAVQQQYYSYKFK